MNDDKTIVDFNVKLLDIPKESFTLGKKISEERLVWKVLRSLPKRFDMKVTAIKEAHGITSVHEGGWASLLLTFEISLDGKPKKKGKGVAMQESFVEEKHDTADRRFWWTFSWLCFFTLKIV